MRPIYSVSGALTCALGLLATGCAGAARETPAPQPAIAVPFLPAESCPRKPDVATNPPVPAGWVQVKDSTVTPEMAAWATDIVKHTKTYPMCSSTLQTFGAATILARVEWHPPDFNVGTVHRGVTLYERETVRMGAALNLPAR